ncbi:MAG: hypothetical protein AB1578_15455, partial [Thermodesulfobacteriota bacterium]
MKTHTRTLAAAAAALFLWGGAAGATDFVREGFENLSGKARAGAAPGRQGGGWTQHRLEFDLPDPPSVDLPARFGAAARGMISFDLQRKDLALESGRRTVFHLLDRDGYGVLLVQWSWDASESPGLPALYFGGADYLDYGLDLWGVALPLDQPVRPGQWVHVDLVWDDGAGR